MEIAAFHACSTLNGPGFIEENGPFISGDDEGQWLTQGYYFWIDDIDLAHSWGNNRTLKGKYSILSATLDIADDVFLDLIAKPLHINFFRELLSLYLERVNGLKGNNYKPTVAECIEHFRFDAKSDENVFPFIAIRASERSLHEGYKFVPLNSYPNKINLDSRHQAVLFEGNEDCIVKKEIVYPDSWVA
jgi:hypothetical protein